MVAATPVHRTGAVGGAASSARILGQTFGAVAMALDFNLFGPRAPVLATTTAACISLGAAVVSLRRLDLGPGRDRARLLQAKRRHF
jgi:DHA2 family multidrug resistance protein-like MFS transporter